jgi:glycosyltransferase involved in cell wall biosynthesis
MDATSRNALRVALLLPELAGGGAERVLLEVAHGLIEHGIDVDVVLVRPGGALSHAVPDAARVIGLDSTRTLLAGRRLRRYLARESPAVVISALTPTNVANVVVTRLVRPRIPTIVTQHNMTAAHSTTKADRGGLVAARRAFPFADRIVAVSEGVAADLVDTLGIDPEIVSVIHNPVISSRLFTDAAAPVEHPWLARKEGPVLLAVGRLTAQKDFATLLRAVALLPATHRLVILGEGELRGELLQLAEHLGIRERVDLPGYLANPFPCFASADVVVLSSRFEGLPTVLIEALPFACGIVATDCPSGPREILEGGQWGRLVPCGQPAALADAINAEIGARRARPHDAWLRYEVNYAVERYIALITALAGSAREPNADALHATSR